MAAPVERAVVHGGLVAAPVKGLGLSLFQKAVGKQQAGVDEIGVCRKGGKTLIGAVAVAGGADGQDLPVALAGGGEKIHKTLCLFAQRADAVRPRQAGQGQQDARGSHPFTAPATTPSMMYFWQAR